MDNNKEENLTEGIKIIGLGLYNLFQTFEDLDNNSDRQMDAQAVRDLFDKDT